MRFLDGAKAYSALGSLSGWKLPPRVAYQVFKVKGELRKICSFMEDEERKLVTEMGGTVSDNGKINFDEPDNYQHYCEAVDKMYSENIPDVSFTPIKIDLSMCNGELSVAIIEALDGVVEFCDTKESEDN